MFNGAKHLRCNILIRSFVAYLSIWEKWEKHFGCKPVLVCEATGHYHRILLHFFSHKGFEMVVLNPIQSACVKNINIRKVKTNEIDSLRIAYLYRLKKFSPAVFIPDEVLSLKELCHHHAKLVELLTTIKNQTLTILDQFMPGYQGIFYDTFGQASLKLLSQFPSPTDILTAGWSGLSDLYENLSRNES